MDSGVRRWAEQTLSHLTHALDGFHFWGFLLVHFFFFFLANPRVWKSWDEKSPRWKSRGSRCNVSAKLTAQGRLSCLMKGFFERPCQVSGGEICWTLPHPLLSDASHLLLLSLSFCFCCQTYYWLHWWSELYESLSLLPDDLSHFMAPLKVFVHVLLCFCTYIRALRFVIVVERCADVDVIWWQTL